MVRSSSGGLPFEEDHGYAVFAAGGAQAQRSGLSHAAAMVFAEELRHVVNVVVVMHMVGGKGYEVDRYPLR